jgi:hypothetical protein
MLVVFGFVLLVLTAALVLLFAMMGELASRMPDSTRRVPIVQPSGDAAIGRVPAVWPAELPDARRSVLLVLSTICGSCVDIATQLRELPCYAEWDELGLVISTNHQRGGDEFVAQYGLNRFRHYVDEGGAWVGEQFDVRVSPVALVFRGGRLDSAYGFNDIAALRNELDNRGRTEPSEQQTEPSEQQKEAV